MMIIPPCCGSRMRLLLTPLYGVRESGHTPPNRERLRVLSNGSFFSLLGVRSLATPKGFSTIASVSVRHYVCIRDVVLVLPLLIQPCVDDHGSKPAYFCRPAWR
eukprot:6171629-Amphidinium_carterae.3